MKNMNLLKSMKTKCIALGLLSTMMVSGVVPAFDSDKPVITLATSYSQNFTTNAWDGTKFYAQWDALNPNIFTATDIALGYLRLTWDTKRMIYSKTNYATPYIFETDIEHEAYKGGIVIRAKVTNVTNAEYLQDANYATPNFNREGIALYPSSDAASMNVQFSGVEAAAATTRSLIVVPKPTGVTSMLNRAMLRIEDFGTSIYVYYNGNPYIRIDLGGLSGTNYTSGTVYNADMVSKGTFTGMEVAASGRVAIAQRVAAKRLYSATIKTPTIISGVTNLISKFKISQQNSSIIMDLDGLSGQQLISIYDVQGKIVLNRQAMGGEKLTIEKSLKSGVYIVKVDGVEHSLKTKLVVR